MKYMKKQNDDFMNDMIKSFGVAIRTCGLILGLTVLGTAVAFVIFEFILFIGDKLNVL